MKLIIADAIFEDFPELVLGVVVVRHGDNTQDRPEVTQLLRQAEAGLPGVLGGHSVSQHPFITTWREAYRKFGAKPKDYPSSVENLARRVRAGAALGHVNNLVALYNTVSLRHLLPAGGEDLDQIVGDVWLTRAGADEPAILLLGEKEARPPRPGEVIYRDEAGAICRRWNWREADRTKLTPATQNAFLVIEALPPVPRDAAAAAIRELADLVLRYCGGLVSTTVLDAANREAELT